MRTLYSLATAASLATLASGQVRLTELTTIDLDSTSDNANAEFIGTNPSAVAWDGTSLFIAGFNGGGATADVGIVKVSDPLGAATLGTAFGAISTPSLRGYSGLDVAGAKVAAAYDNGGSSPDGITQWDAATEMLEWSKEGRGGSGVAINPGFPGGDPAFGEGVAWATFGSGRVRLQDSATGADIWDGSNGAVIFTSEGSFFRDLDYADATGDVWVREGNNVISFERTGDNALAGGVIVFDQDPDADFVAGQNIAYLDGQGAVVYNDRTVTAGGQPFADVVKFIDESGAALPTDFGGFAPADGAGYYDFSWDGASNTLALLDFSNRNVTIFSVETGPEPTPIFGIDLRQDRAFESQTSDFVNNFVELGPATRSIFGLDFDADAQELYGVDNTSLEIVTIDLVTGEATPTGALLAGPTGISGLTAAPDGVNWYLSDFDGTDTILYRGDVQTGNFATVGTIAPGIIIDISMDSQGNLFGLSISDDSLYSIDPISGAGTPIGTGIGLNPNFAQGMDFDWSTDVLYATVYTGGGTGAFCSIDLVTGVANVLADTFPLNAEMEMACRASSPIVGTNYCMAEPNSTGVPAAIRATGSASLATNNLVLSCTDMPQDAFAIFIASQTQDFVPMSGGGMGNLCLGGSIGRGVGGQIFNSGSTGTIKASVDWQAVPQPMGAVAAIVGETWNFQTVMRDVDGMGGATSNLSDAVSVVVE